jgi:hypothetical protein
MFQVLRIPILRPVFVREQTNKMYSPTAYFLAGWCSSTIFLFIFPIISSGITFNGSKFKNNTFGNYLNWLGVSSI